MTTVTFEADDAMVEAARARARAEETTLEEAMRCWLDEYAGRVEREERAQVHARRDE